MFSSSKHFSFKQDATELFTSFLCGISQEGKASQSAKTRKPHRFDTTQAKLRIWQNVENYSLLWQRSSKTCFGYIMVVMKVWFRALGELNQLPDENENDRDESSIILNQKLAISIATRTLQISLVINITGYGQIRIIFINNFQNHRSSYWTSPHIKGNLPFELLKWRSAAPPYIHNNLLIDEKYMINYPCLTQRDLISIGNWFHDSQAKSISRTSYQQTSQP